MKCLQIIAIFLISFNKCFTQKDSSLPIAITIKTDRDYERIFRKEVYAREVRDFDYVINSDSVKQKYFDITLKITNTSTKPIGIWLMTCSWEDNFIVNNNYIFFSGHACDKNIPTLVKFSAGESKKYETTLRKSIKFDYPCKFCIYGPQVETTKLGLIIIEDIYTSNLDLFDYDLRMEDKSKWKIVWSNPLLLLGKQGEPIKKTN